MQRREAGGDLGEQGRGSRPGQRNDRPPERGVALSGGGERTALARVHESASNREAHAVEPGQGRGDHRPAAVEPRPSSISFVTSDSRTRTDRPTRTTGSNPSQDQRYSVERENEVRAATSRIGRSRSFIGSVFARLARRGQKQDAKKRRGFPTPFSRAFGTGLGCEPPRWSVGRRSVLRAAYFGRFLRAAGSNGGRAS